MKTRSSARLNQIGTRWSLVDRAKQSELAESGFARHELLDRYSGAVWRYLLVSTRDEAAADELFQEFALRLIRGDFRRASAQRGRFRDYLKSVVINLIRDHQRRQANKPCSLSNIECGYEESDAPQIDEEERFIASWREEILNLTWDALERSNEFLFQTLRTQAQIPHATAAEKAHELAIATQSSCDANRFRVSLCRARKKFALLLYREVATSMDDATEADILAELKRLRLAGYCKV